MVAISSNNTFFRGQKVPSRNWFLIEYRVNRHLIYCSQVNIPIAALQHPFVVQASCVELMNRTLSFSLSSSLFGFIRWLFAQGFSIRSLSPPGCLAFFFGNRARETLKPLSSHCQAHSHILWLQKQQYSLLIVLDSTPSSQQQQCAMFNEL